MDLQKPLNQNYVQGNELGEGMLNRFGDRIDELENVMKEIALDITNVTFVEKVPPEKVWEKTGPRVTLVGELVKELREYLFILKPEKVPTVQKHVTSIFERLDVFRETLKAGTTESRDNFQASIDELRQVLGEVSGFISLCREIRGDPSLVISAILKLREAEGSGAPQITQERMQHLGYLLRDTRKAYGEMTEISARMEKQLKEVKDEYDKLMFSLKRKEE